jgi:cell division protein FtsL
MTSVAFSLSRHPMRVPATRRAPAARRGSRAVRASTWETRSFLGAAAAICVAFAFALAYLAGTTGVASVGYEAQRLQATRDELHRQNALLELELARLDSPARIETEAKRLGLIRVSFIPVIPSDALTARK